MKRAVLMIWALLATLSCATSVYSSQAEQILRKSAAVYRKAKTVSLVTDTSGQMPASLPKHLRVTVLFARPDKWRVDMGDGLVKIVDGPDTYKQAKCTREWALRHHDRQTNDSAECTGWNVETLAAGKEPLRNVRKCAMAGVEKLNGVECWIINLQLPDTSPFIRNVRETVWVGKTDYLVRKVRAVMDQQTSPSATPARYTYVTTIGETKFNTKLRPSLFAPPPGAAIKRFPALKKR